MQEAERLRIVWNGIAVSLETNDRQVLTSVSARYARFARSAAPTSNGEPSLRVTSAQDRYVLSVEDRQLEIDAAQSFLIDDALDTLFRAQRTGYLYLHAAAVQLRGGAALIIGPSGYGKSTLSTAMQKAGARVLCDDIAPICTERYAVVPYPTRPARISTPAPRANDSLVSPIPVKLFVYLQPSSVSSKPVRCAHLYNGIHWLCTASCPQWPVQIGHLDRAPRTNSPTTRDLASIDALFVALKLTLQPTFPFDELLERWGAVLEHVRTVWLERLPPPEMAGLVSSWLEALPQSPCDVYQDQ